MFISNGLNHGLFFGFESRHQSRAQTLPPLSATVPSFRPIISSPLVNPSVTRVKMVSNYQTERQNSFAPRQGRGWVSYCPVVFRLRVPLALHKLNLDRGTTRLRRVMAMAMELAVWSTRIPSSIREPRFFTGATKAITLRAIRVEGALDPLVGYRQLPPSAAAWE